MKTIGKASGLILLALILFSGVHFFNAAADNYTFMVEPVYPGNQIEKNSGYYYFDAVKGKPQQLSARIRNTGNTAQTIFIEAADCFTSDGGDLCYITDNKSDLTGITDERFLLSRNVVLEQASLNLAPGESRIFNFSVNPPPVDEGEVLGAIRFYVIKKGAGISPDSSKTQINLDVRNAMSITLRLRFGGPVKDEEKELTFSDAGYIPDMNSFYITLSNDLPFINRYARGAVSVMDEEGERLIDKSFNLIKMAPKSWVKYQIPWGEKRPESGKYSVEVSLNGAGIGRREILLEDDDVEMIDETPPGTAPEVPGLASDNKLLIYGGWIMFAITAIFLLTMVFIKRRKSEGKKP